MGTDGRGGWEAAPRASAAHTKLVHHTFLKLAELGWQTAGVCGELRWQTAAHALCFPLPTQVEGNDVVCRAQNSASLCGLLTVFLIERSDSNGTQKQVRGGVGGSPHLKCWSIEMGMVVYEIASMLFCHCSATCSTSCALRSRHLPPTALPLPCHPRAG